ncbi:PEP-CTERM sorting domain-containing protein [Rubellicoccus peritrichatus]|uniref:PEP-CTERM sorting domain-containing protein n=1 Tax=Rubellicoccus peritrichatus TaxID=3080537 RepID=A0AAQ3QVT0_9BACT|nr:PEP-CTERM sorting domain-containing protein [Puniceicoccus sp. CR14]WOO41220.1 PEP-CTERM sorting domain-containing protein [Puniceicoccus sp. CR14]
MKTTLLTSLATIGLCGSLFGQTIFSEDFQTGQTVGTQPTGATSVRPSVNTADVFTEIVTGANNPAGGGVVGNNGVQIFDNNASAAGLEYNFVGDTASQISALRIDMDFANITTGAGDGVNINLGAGEYNSSTSLRMNASSRRFMEVRFEEDATVDFISASGSSSANNALVAGQNTLSIFINDFDSTSITYTRPDTGASATLAANSVAYFLNAGDVANRVFFETLLDLNDPTIGGTVGTTENNFGRFGFATNTSSIGLNYNYDNLAVSIVPEPGTYAGLAGVAALFLVALRRRRG